MKTWHHPTACRFQSWNTSDQVSNRTGTQSHPSIKRPPKDFLIVQPPLGTPFDKAQPTKEPRSNFPHHSLPPGRFHKPLDQPLPPGSRQLKQKTYSLTPCGAESTNRSELKMGPAGTPPCVMRGNCTARTHRTYSTEGFFFKVKNNNFTHI